MPPPPPEPAAEEDADADEVVDDGEVGLAWESSDDVLTVELESKLDVGFVNPDPVGDVREADASEVDRDD